MGVVACTKSNPAKHCADGTCTDPNYPFCDVSGAVSGEEGTCVASSCTANAFVECRGDVEVRCNVDGSGYDLTKCERGCDAASEGCHLCDPGETACTNGQLAICDAAGSVIDSEECPLGCFEAEPRCRGIDPSNGLAQYLDAIPGPPDLDLSSGTWRIDTSTGVIAQDQGESLTVPSFLIEAPTNGAAIRVFVVGNATLGHVIIGPYSSRPALAIVARGAILVAGSVSVGGGALSIPGCNGGDGAVYTRSNHTQCLVTGSGGGANGTNGGRAGGIDPFDAGGAGGVASGTVELVPLRGGCEGGGFTVENYPHAGGVQGGGALQLSSERSITISGMIGAGGGYVYQPEGPTGCGIGTFGGGAGGSILLEAPVVTLDDSAKLLVPGGTGYGTPPNSATMYYGAEGPGASLTSSGIARDGGSVTYVTSGQNDFQGGGGGGGWGRIRINTRDGTYAKSSASIEDGALTTGTVGTR
jgi:hypothetical protein